MTTTSEALWAKAPDAEKMLAAIAAADTNLRMYTARPLDVRSAAYIPTFYPAIPQS
jgi:hypothetical protein